MLIEGLSLLHRLASHPMSHWIDAHRYLVIGLWLVSSLSSLIQSLRHVRSSLPRLPSRREALFSVPTNSSCPGGQPTGRVSPRRKRYDVSRLPTMLRQILGIHEKPQGSLPQAAFDPFRALESLYARVCNAKSNNNCT